MLPDLVGSLVEVRLDGLDELVQAGSVLGLDAGDGHARSRLSACNSSKPGLVLDNAIGNTHLAAQGRKEQDQLEKDAKIYTLQRESRSNNSAARSDKCKGRQYFSVEEIRINFHHVDRVVKASGGSPRWGPRHWR